ncbi:MAG: helix-turn-helix domain-containing protein [Eubacterium sp.]|nr:helix-turn-helix domain-containing protein [Eubacterium sp.]
MNKKSQCERIIDYINEFGSITTSEAFDDLGCTRLASRIHDLKRKGYEFNKQYEKGKNRYGDSVSYIRYSLKKAA